MDWVPLWRKELVWSRHNWLALLLLLLVLPAALAGVTVAFQDVIPRDSPVAVVPKNDSVTATDLRLTRGLITAYTTPVTYESQTAAFRALEREQVYAVIIVPPDVTNEAAAVRYDVSIDGSIVPYKEPSRAIVGVMRYYFNDNLPAESVAVERTIVGADRTLSEYLVPTFMLVMTILLAFAYLPYALARERPVVDRLRVSSSLDAAIGTKLAHFTLLSLVPILATGLAADALGYDIAPLSPLAVAGLILTFGYLGALSTAVMVALDFSWTGRVVNLLFVVCGVLLSNLVYPAGYFSPVRGSVARLSPLHYSAIVVRSGVLKGSGIELFADQLAGLVLATVVALGLLKLAIRRYERRA